MLVVSLALLSASPAAAPQQAWPQRPPAFPGVLLGIEDVEHVITADLDGDGDLDLVTLDAGASSLRVHLGTGEGSFVADALPPVSSPQTMTLRGAVAADFDGDGDPDVAVIGDVGLEGRLYTFLNDGSGALSLQTSKSFAKRGEALSAADVDGDGWTDLLMLRDASPALQLLRSQGPSGFATPQWIDAPTGWSFARDYDVGDVDGDGRPDLVTLNWGSSPPTPSAFLYANDGLGGFSTPVPLFPIGEFAQRVLLADLRGDGVLHAAVVEQKFNQTPTLYWFENDGSSNFAFRQRFTGAGFPPDVTPGLAVRDLDGDGREEWVVETPSGNLGRLVLKGSTLVLAGEELIRPSGPWRGAGDFDSDGAEDLLTAVGSFFTPGSLALSRGDGEGQLARTVVSDGVAAFAAADAVLLELIGDAGLDLVVSASFEHELHVFEGLGDGRFELVQTLYTRDRPMYVAVGDFDGDGLEDLGVLESFDPFVEVFLQTPGTTWVSVGSTLPTQNPLGFGAGPLYALDSDADGRDELAYFDAGSGLLRMIGLDDASLPVVLAELDLPDVAIHGVSEAPPGAPQALELIAPGSASYLSLWLLVDPLGTQPPLLVERLPLPLPAPPPDLLLAGLPRVSDPDGDGLIEVWATYSSAFVGPTSVSAAWKAEVIGGFGAPQAFRAPYPLVPRWSGDVDGDGEVDRVYGFGTEITMQGFPILDRIQIHRPALGDELGRSESYPWYQHAPGDVNGDGATDMVLLVNGKVVSLIAAPKR